MVVVGVLTALLSFILFELGMLIKDSRKTLKNIEDITSDAHSVVSTVKGTVQEVSDMVIKPVRAIGSGISAISGFMSGLKGDEPVEEE